VADNPLVSVLMTAYNREDYIAQAIESALASTYTQFELIIVDDVSEDRTVEIAERYRQKDKRIQIHRNEKNIGDYPNRNRAAGLAKGKYIKYLDSDDILYAHCLGVMVSAMERFPEAGFGLSAVYDAKGPYPVCLSPHDAYMEHFYGFSHFNRAPGSSIMPKRVFDAVGGFTGKRMIGDNELWFTLARDYPMVKLPRDLVWSRLHEGQESRSSYADNYREMIRQVMEEAFSHEDCPLSVAEMENIRKMLQKKNIKQRFFKIFK